jgi:hypothetical protein
MVELTRMEQLQVRRGQLDIMKYRCPECGHIPRNTLTELHHGMPIPGRNPHIFPSLAFPLELGRSSNSASRMTKMRLKDTPEIRQALSAYQLFVFVLFDPQKHSAMQQRMQKRYEQLDEDTGDSLLFFSYFQPGQSWLAQRQHDEPALIDMWEAEYDDNPALSIDLLSIQLNINIQQLPCLVITTSLYDACDYLLLPTTDEDVVRKLVRLTDIANGLAADPYSRNQPSEFTLSNIEHQLTQTYGDIVRRRKLDQVQKNLFAVIQPNEHLTSADVVSSIREKVDALASARAQLNELYNATESDEFQMACLDIEETCAALMSWLQASMRHVSVESQLQLPELRIPKDAIEASSAQYMDTYRVLAQMYTQIMHDPTAQGGIDYAPFAILLTKLFELEINLSIVQLIRFIHDIDMPTYYNKYQAGKTVIIETHDFNKHQHNVLRLPGIGQSYYVVKHRRDAIREQSYELLLQAGYEVSKSSWEYTFQKILNKWDQINPRRNHVAHPDPVTLQQVEEIVELLNGIGDSFNYLAALKSFLSKRRSE